MGDTGGKYKKWGQTPIPSSATKSEAAFNRAFKREFGVTPAKWRREARVG